MGLRHEATARVATADCLIAVLVHRDPHFASLPDGRPAQEVLPDKG